MTEAFGLAAGSASPRRLMSTSEVADLFGKTERTIRNWVKEGFLTPIRIGRAVYFDRAAVEALATNGI